MADKRSAGGVPPPRRGRGVAATKADLLLDLRGALSVKLDAIAGRMIAGGLQQDDALALVAEAATTEGLERLRAVAGKTAAEADAVGLDFCARRSAEPPVPVAPPETVSPDRWNEIRGRCRTYLRAFMGEIVDCMDQMRICSRHEALGAMIAGMDDIILDYTTSLAKKDYKSPYASDRVAEVVNDIDEKVIGAARAESACIATIESLRPGAEYIADEFKVGLCAHAPWMGQQIVGAALKRLGIEFLKSGMADAAAAEAMPGEKLH